MVDVPKEWENQAREAADEFLRRRGVPNLTAEQAEAFAELGLPQMRKMIGRPVEYTPEDYLRFLEGGPSHDGLDLGFMLHLSRGGHLNKRFLANAN